MASRKQLVYEQLEISAGHNDLTLSEPITPPLKWAGGKRWLTPLLAQLFATVDYKRLVEPFVGGMAVALALRPDKALLNDANPHLVNFYRELKKGLKIQPGAFQQQSLFYYRKRLRFNALVGKKKATGKEAASIFYYLNRTGFNGLCRFNSKGRFNVPFGRHSKINYTYNFSEYKSVLKNWKLVCDDFEELEIMKGDLIYADPPYDVEFTRYSTDDFVWKDQLRLAKWLSKQRGPVVVSNQATERIVELYKSSGFDVYGISAPRLISCNGDRSRAREVLAFKNLKVGERFVGKELLKT